MRNDHIQFLKNLIREMSESFVIDDLYCPKTGEYNTTFIGHEEVDYSAVASSRIAHCILLYYSKESKFYRNDIMLETAKSYLKKLLSMAHEDGTHDLYRTNFHDPNQVGFVNHPLFSVFILQKYTEHTKLEDEVFDLFVQNFKKSVYPLCNLGFHTPNHRWVQTASLSLIKNFVDDPQIQQTIDKYLWEGIDCDENGEYSERSAGTYNQVSDDAFLLCYSATGDKQYLEYVRRNLMLMKSFIEPDFTINTMNSLRQDQSETGINFSKYYYCYLVTAAVLQDEEMGYMADKIFDYFQSNPAYKYYSNPFYVALMSINTPNFEELVNSCPSSTKKENCSRIVKKSGIARYYLNTLPATVTLVKSHGVSAPDFFKFMVGKSVVYGRFSGSFFGYPHSQFSPKDLDENEDGSITLSAYEEQGYRSQFKEPPETSDWRHMDHSKREWINIQHFNTFVKYKLNEDESMSFDITTEGTTGVCAKFELSFITNFGKVINDSCEVLAKKGGFMIASGNFNFYDVENGVLYTIKSGKHQHAYAHDMRGAAKINDNRFTIAFTDFSPVNRHIEIKARKHFNEGDLFKFD